jgi:uncharacterized protein YbaR (Trm112 family)
MRVSTLEFLRCPYCGGALELVESIFHRRGEEAIQEGVLACHCCVFPVVDGIPVMHLQPPSTAAREHIEAGRPELARRLMFGLEDETQAARFEQVIDSPASTYREMIDALGPGFESGYFLYRFSDPTFVVADAVVRATAAAVLGREGRAVDLCGGSGHLTRSLSGATEAPPVLADLYFAKVWLARRFTAPGCEPVCCDGNAPFPFARGAFRLAICTDAFMYIWTKRQFVGEMERLVDVAGRGHSDAGAVVIGHAHNARVWSPSHGQALPPEAYAQLFEISAPQLFAEATLLDGMVTRGVVDLSRPDPPDVLDGDPALTIVASRHTAVFTRREVAVPIRAAGEFRLNPLYERDGNASPDRYRLQFPDQEYAQEYAASRRYLPDTVTLERAVVERLPAPILPPALEELARRRVILDLPLRYW